MDIFVKITDLDRKTLFQTLKGKLSWEKIFPILGIKRSMFFHYLSGKYPIPQDIFLKMQKISKLNIKNKQLIKKPRYLPKNISEPILDEKLAEIFGALNGDGHLDSINYEICIVGDKKEQDYSFYLKDLFEEKLGLKFNVFFQNNTYKLRTYSKQMVNLLNKKYQIPIGNKMGQLIIPKVIKSNRDFLSSYIRGLFDTDGCFHVRRKRNLMISITSADKYFLEEVRKSLFELGFKPAKGEKKVFVYGEKVNKFFNLVKPANNKHLKKFNMYLENMRG